MVRTKNWIKLLWLCFCAATSYVTSPIKWPHTRPIALGFLEIPPSGNYFPPSLNLFFIMHPLRQLTLNFELRVEFFCVQTCFHMRIPKLSCLSACPYYPEKRNLPTFVNISPTVVIDTSMERSLRVLHHGNPPKNDFLFEQVRN